MPIYDIKLSYGVKLSYILTEFFESNGGRRAFDGLTTTDVRAKFIVIKAKERRCSMCELLVSEGNPVVGEANVFVSHAWSYMFLDLVEALEQHFRYHIDVVVWLDIFSVNQIVTPDLNDFWFDTFEGAIGGIGYSVMVLAPWHNPTPFTRGWCLFELYCTIKMKCRFEVAMSSGSTEQFLADICRDAVGEDNRMKSVINVSNSKCYKEEDRAKIFHLIMASIGVDEVNSVIFEKMREWVLGATSLAREKAKDMDVGKYLALTIALGHLYYNQGRYAEAEPLYVECFSLSKSKLGLDHPDTLTSMNNLANLYNKQGRYAEAERLYIDCFDLRKTELGPDHPDTLTSISGLATLYYKQGRYVEAEPLYVECFNLSKTKLGPDHPDTLTSMNVLANLYNKQGRYADAERLYVECIELRKSKLGPDHPHTLASMNNLASLYSNQGRYSESERLYVECIDLRKTKLGPDHPGTSSSMNNLANLYYKQGRYAESERLYVECIVLRKSKLGPDHPHTLTSMNSLADLYNRQGRYAEAERLLFNVLI